MAILPVAAPSAPSAPRVVAAIADALLAHRRAHATDAALPAPADAVRPWLTRTLAPFVRAGQPVPLVLVGFSFKSPSPARVLGSSADLADRLGLEVLAALGRTIAVHHAPGATVTIYSDGWGFHRVLGVPDAAVMAYAADIRAMLADVAAEAGLPDGMLRYVTLDEAVHPDPAVVVAALQARYRAAAGVADDTDDTFRELLARDPALALHTAGLAAFFRGELRECARHGDWPDTDTADGAPQPVERTQAALKHAAARRARAVVRLVVGVRDWVQAAHPAGSAVRLSIHPTPAATEKLGIYLGPGPDNQVSPWHSTAVETGYAAGMGPRFVLARRGWVEPSGWHRAADPRTGAAYLARPAVLAANAPLDELRRRGLRVD